jgi:adenosylcobinamide kinase/adenosylcobinamide-phosphate guanylyltransferase
MAKITLIVGGARSGKSTLALELAEQTGQTIYFVATATGIDTEMQKRIADHKKERADTIITIEEERAIFDALRDKAEVGSVAVVDCLTVWLGNVYFYCGDDGIAVKKKVDECIAMIPASPCDLIMVTNEVGCGIVPNNDLARSYRDMSGYMNKKAAAVADTVYLCTCGIPLKIKG